MKTRLAAIDKMILLSVAFTMALLAGRIVISGQLTYVFYVWNLILAVIPLCISGNLLRRNKLRAKEVTMLLCWLLFFPNAPYIITDIFHFAKRPPLPLWFDLLLVTSAAWNGLIIGVTSLMQVERFLHRHMNSKRVFLVILLCLMLCSFGIYIGRFLRFNSWDVVANPADIAYSIFYRIKYPLDNPRTWGFTILFGCMLSLVYFTIKKLPRIKGTAG